MQGWMNKFLTPVTSSTTTLIHVFITKNKLKGLV